MLSSLRRYLLVTLFASLLGCASHSGNLTITTPEANTSIQQSASGVTLLALKALSRDEAAHQSIKSKVVIAQQAVESVVIPLFQGHDLNSITGATATQALSLLDGKLDPTLKGVIQLAVNGALVFLKLPSNPTAKLTDDQRGMIVGLFQGIDQGLIEFQTWPGPSARDIGPAVVPAVKGLSWQYGGER